MLITQVILEARSYVKVLRMRFVELYLMEKVVQKQARQVQEKICNGNAF